MKALVYKKSARRSWRKLPAEVQTRIGDALERYAETGEGDVKRLNVREGARLRAGDYRVIFTETEYEIEVRAVGHRKDIYR
jgi:mRNA interferase RelE/StbE